MELSFHFRGIRHPATHEVQLNEVRLFSLRDAMLHRLWPERASNPRGESPRRQGAANVLNGSKGGKWIDMNFKRHAGSRLNMFFNRSARTILAELVAYELVTANDNPTRDPTEWTLSARRSDATWLPWVVLDRRSGVTPPRARFASYGPFWLPLPMQAPPSPPVPSPPPPPPHDALPRGGTNASLDRDSARSSACSARQSRCEPFCTHALARHPDRHAHHCSICQCGACSYCLTSPRPAARAASPPPKDGPGQPKLSEKALLARSKGSTSDESAASATCNYRSARCTPGPCTFNASMSNQSPIRTVLVIGDSLLAPGTGEGGCSALTDELASKYDLVVENRARNGMAFHQIAGQYHRGGSWTYVVISGGVNDVPSNATASSHDINHMISSGKRSAENGAQYGGLLPKLVLRILSEGVSQVVLVGYPEGEGLSPGKPRHRPIKLLKLRLKLFAAALAPKVQFIDGALLFGPYPRDKSQFAPDKSHPSSAGAATIGRAIGQSLKSHR